MQQFKEDWYDYERSVQDLMNRLKDHAEFESISGNDLQIFMAENFVMNYSNIEL